MTQTLKAMINGPQFYQQKQEYFASHNPVQKECRKFLNAIL